MRKRKMVLTVEELWPCFPTTGDLAGGKLRCYLLVHALDIGINRSVLFVPAPCAIGCANTEGPVWVCHVIGHSRPSTPAPPTPTSWLDTGAGPWRCPRTL